MAIVSHHIPIISHPLIPPSMDWCKGKIWEPPIFHMGKSMVSGEGCPVIISLPQVIIIYFFLICFIIIPSYHVHDSTILPYAPSPTLWPPFLVRGQEEERRRSRRQRRRWADLGWWVGGMRLPFHMFGIIWIIYSRSIGELFRSYWEFVMIQRAGNSVLDQPV